MKHTWVALGVASVLAAPGCKKGSSGPPECNKLGDLMTAAAKLPGDQANASTILAGLCDRETWNAEVRTCMAGATDRAAIQACAAGELDATSQKRLTVRLDLLAQGGDAAKQAGNWSALEGGAAKPPATCRDAGIRMGLAVAALVRKLLKEAPKGDLDATAGLVTIAVCERDKWSSDVLDCARDARNEKGALDPCVDKMPRAQAEAWTQATLAAVAEVEQSIADGKATPGASWSGTLAP